MQEELLELAGLSASAEIVVDRWGIPHISADNLPDLFLVQGFNAARDRLWQIDMWRKRGLGLLAADFGPGFLAQDYAARLFLFRGDMDAEWAAYGSDARTICEAFVAGVNAYIALTEREPSRLPPEFALLGTKPAPWSAEDVVRIRSHGLTRNALSEVLRANVLARADGATDLLRKNIEPRVAPHRAKGLDLSAVPVDALDLFRLATAAVTFTSERLGATIDEAWGWSKVTDLGDVVRDEAFQGSNNWAVHGSRTATGRPILANDPHRTHAAPSLRYLVHLTAPGFDAIGAGEPCVPGLSLGHNGRIAFGVTIFGADQEDVYVYETNPGDGDAYRYGDAWEAMTLEEDLFAVKGADVQVLTMRFTRHGPVVFEDGDANTAIAIRSVWFAPGSAAYLASLSSMRAGSFDEFRAALRRWGAPAANHVCADTAGTVAWQAAGFSPIRPNWDGLLPVTGDGRYEWAGFLDPDLMPQQVNPAEGFVATANEMNLPADWPHDARQVGYEWIDNARAARIREVLGAETPHTIAASCALQTDVLSMPARRLGALVAELAVNDAAAAAAVAMLAQWDHRLTADSAAAALFEVWWTHHLKPVLFTRLVPDAKVRALMPPGDVEGILGALEHPDSRFGPRPLVARDNLLMATLSAAMRDCAARMGEDVAGWAWGKLHHGYFEHALSGIGACSREVDTGSPQEHAPSQEEGHGPALSRAGMDCGPFPVGGSAATPMHAGYRPGDFRAIAGASVRIVVDVGAWDNCVCINAPGQSGDPRSPHYRDLAPLWAKGDFVPMLYSREAIEREGALRIMLMPG